MELHPRLQQFIRQRLPLILAVYILIQPLLDILTAFGALAEHTITAGVLVRTLFLVFGFVYVVFASNFSGKKWCLACMGALVAYLVLFMLYMFSLGGISLCLSNIKELTKVFFAPFVVIFLYAVYRQYGYLISTRTLAWTGGLYAGVILLAFLTGTSFVSYANSGYGYKGWFYAANEVSCIIALVAPFTICRCLNSLSASGKKDWKKLLPVLLAFASIAFSANFIGTKIVFAITLVYCLAAFVWSLVRRHQLRTPELNRYVLITGVLAAVILALYFVSPLQSYISDIYVEIMDESSELRIVSWGKEIQEASKGTWLRQLLSENAFLERLDQILSRRIFSASPSVQVFTEGGFAAKLLGIGYANVESYGRSIEFMIEMDPFAILIRHGILGFLLYYGPYVACIVYFIIQFFKRPARRLSSLEYCTYLYSVLCGFAISAVAGHALVSPGVSIFILATILNLWVRTREQNREAA